MDFSPDCFAFTLAAGRYRFDASPPEASQQLQQLLTSFLRRLRDFSAVSQGGAIEQRDSLHDQVVTSLATIGSIGGLQFASKAHGEFARKCREHHDYLLQKCEEQSTTPPSRWNDGVTFASDTIESITTILRVVGETVTHVHNHMVEELGDDNTKPIESNNPRGKSPIALASSVAPSQAMGKGTVVVANGWYRTGSTLCFYAVQRILAAKGLSFRVIGQDYKHADRMIADHLRSGTDQWLLLKSHHWMPSETATDRVIALYTKRHPADIMRSTLALRRRQKEDAGLPYDEEAELGEFVSGLHGLLLFYRYILPRMPMNVIDYETYYGQPKLLTQHLAGLLGLALTDEQATTIAADLDVKRIKDWTDRLDRPMDEQSHFRKRAISEDLGRPNGSLEGLPEAMRVAIAMAHF